MSLFGNDTDTFRLPACVTVKSFITLDVVGSFGSSWCAVSVVVSGWLSPKASAEKPGRSMPAWNVTSNEPVPSSVLWSTWSGSTVALARVVSNGM